MSGGCRVAITGIGAVTALGHDLAALWSGVTRGASGIRPIANIPTDRLIVNHAAEVVDFDPAAHFEPRRLPMLDRTSQLALVAAREAMAGIEVDRVDPSRAGVILGAAIGQETFDSSYKALYGENAKRLHPMTVPRMVRSQEKSDTLDRRSYSPPSQSHRITTNNRVTCHGGRVVSEPVETGS
jgi:nodulation protein E